MNGTSFSVTRTAFCRPPRTQSTSRTATRSPAAHGGTPTAPSAAETAPVCAIVPMPSAESTQPAA